MICDLLIVQLLEHEVAVAGDADLRQVDDRRVTAVRVILLGEGDRAVPDHFPEACGSDIFGTVVDVVTEIEDNGDLRLQKTCVLLGAGLGRSAGLDRHDGRDVFNRHIPADSAALGMGDEAKIRR